MIASTRGRYALRVLIDLVEHRHDGCVPMKDIAARQGISKKYLEQIMPLLTKAGLVTATHGQGGGYRLGRDPRDCTVGKILRLTEGDLAPVACLAPGAAPCPRTAACRTFAMWRRFGEITNAYFDGITLWDLAADPADPREQSAEDAAL